LTDVSAESTRVVVGGTTTVGARLLDQNRDPISGHPVRFRVAEGGGSVSAGEVHTDADGRAATEWTLGVEAGTNRLEASVENLETRTVQVRGDPDVAATVQIEGPESVHYGTNASVEIVAADQHGNEIEFPNVEWFSSDEEIFRANGKTLIPRGMGFAQLIARVDEAADTLDVEVLPPSLNLSIDGLYINQSVQRYDGSLPLVAGRPGLLRVFGVANETNSRRPDIEVRIYHEGVVVETKTLKASRSVVTEVDEGDFDSSWNVEIAGELIQPGMAIRAEISPDRSIPEADYDDNVFPL